MLGGCLRSLKGLLATIKNKNCSKLFFNKEAFCKRPEGHSNRKKGKILYYSGYLTISICNIATKSGYVFKEAINSNSDTKRQTRNIYFKSSLLGHLLNSKYYAKIIQAGHTQNFNEEPSEQSKRFVQTLIEHTEMISKRHYLSYFSLSDKNMYNFDYKFNIDAFYLLSISFHILEHQRYELTVDLKDNIERVFDNCPYSFQFTPILINILTIIVKITNLNTQFMCNEKKTCNDQLTLPFISLVYDKLVSKNLKDPNLDCLRNYMSELWNLIKGSQDLFTQYNLSKFFHLNFNNIIIEIINNI